MEWKETTYPLFRFTKLNGKNGIKTEYANPCLSITFPFIPFIPFKRKRSVFFEGAGSDKRVRVGGVWACVIGRNETEKTEKTE